MYEEHGMPDADFPGVPMDNERDVLNNTQAAKSEEQTFTASEVASFIDERGLRAAALQAAMSTNPLSAPDLIAAAVQIEDYLRNGAPSATEG